MGFDPGTSRLAALATRRVAAYAERVPGYTHAVPAPLQRYVASCVGYDYRLPPETVHHGIPSSSLTLIIQFDAPLDVRWPGGDEGNRFDVLLSGLHTRPALIHTHGRQHGIQLGLTPAGAGLFGVQAGGLGNTLCPGTELPGFPASLHARLHEADWPTRFALLDTHLFRRAHRLVTSTRPELDRAWSLLSQGAGSGDTRQSVAAVAQDVGWSRRHLQTQFRAHFGVAPKEFSRIARLERARTLLEAGRTAAAAASLSGYADQPHLIREFRALAGITPGQLEDDFPILQDNAV